MALSYHCLRDDSTFPCSRLSKAACSMPQKYHIDAAAYKATLQATQFGGTISRSGRAPIQAGDVSRHFTIIDTWTGLL